MDGPRNDDDDIDPQNFQNNDPNGGGSGGAGGGGQQNDQNNVTNSKRRGDSKGGGENPVSKNNSEPAGNLGGESSVGKAGNEPTNPQQSPQKSINPEKKVDPKIGTVLPDGSVQYKIGLRTEIAPSWAKGMSYQKFLETKTYLSAITKDTEILELLVKKYTENEIFNIDSLKAARTKDILYFLPNSIRTGLKDIYNPIKKEQLIKKFYDLYSKPGVTKPEYWYEVQQELEEIYKNQLISNFKYKNSGLLGEFKAKVENSYRTSTNGGYMDKYFGSRTDYKLYYDLSNAAKTYEDPSILDCFGLSNKEDELFEFINKQMPKIIKSEQDKTRKIDLYRKYIYITQKQYKNIKYSIPEYKILQKMSEALAQEEMPEKELNRLSKYEEEYFTNKFTLPPNMKNNKLSIILFTNSIINKLSKNQGPGDVDTKFVVDIMIKEAKDYKQNSYYERAIEFALMNDEKAAVEVCQDLRKLLNENPNKYFDNPGEMKNVLKEYEQKFAQNNEEAYNTLVNELSNITIEEALQKLNSNEYFKNYLIDNSNLTKDSKPEDIKNAISSAIIYHSSRNEFANKALDDIIAYIGKLNKSNLKDEKILFELNNLRALALTYRIQSLQSSNIAKSEAYTKILKSDIENLLFEGNSLPTNLNNKEEFIDVIVDESLNTAFYLSKSAQNIHIYSIMEKIIDTQMCLVFEYHTKPTLSMDVLKCIETQMKIMEGKYGFEHKIDKTVDEIFDGCGDNIKGKSKDEKLKKAISILNKYLEDNKLPEDADYDTVKKAYRKLIMKYHTDKHEQDPKKIEEFNKKSQEINAANALLKEIEKDSKN